MPSKRATSVRSCKRREGALGWGWAVYDLEDSLLCGGCNVSKALSLGWQDCRDGHRALYARAPQLFRDLPSARAEGTLTKMLATLARVEALAVDDFALEPIDETARRDFLEVCADRYLLSSQLPVDKWHEAIGDPTVADSILDRMVHNAHGFDLSGESVSRLRARGAAGRRSPARRCLVSSRLAVGVADCWNMAEGVVCHIERNMLGLCCRVTGKASQERTVSFLQ